MTTTTQLADRLTEHLTGGEVNSSNALDAILDQLATDTTLYCRIGEDGDLELQHSVDGSSRVAVSQARWKLRSMCARAASRCAIPPSPYGGRGTLKREYNTSVPDIGSSMPSFHYLSHPAGSGNSSPMKFITVRVIEHFDIEFSNTNRDVFLRITRTK